MLMDMATIVHFDLPADEPERAKRFYESLFGWKFNSIPGMDYHFIETADAEGEVGVAGGMSKRTSPEDRIINYMGVDSIDDHMEKVEALGGNVIRPKIPVPGWGYLALCQDTEGNLFGLWQEDKSSR
jgi:predicted enzyme related to lactoylglutathione lyase